jgi:hypothetical protein
VTWTGPITEALPGIRIDLSGPRRSGILTKFVFPNPKTYSGATGVSGVELLLSGDGALPNTSGITIQDGGALKIDQTTTTINSKINDSAAIFVDGGTMAFVNNGPSRPPARPWGR